MYKETVYLIDLSNDGFRCFEPAEIMGVNMVTPDGLEPRLCYHLKWSDGVEDWKPLYEKQYKIVTFNDLLTGEFKE